VAETENVEWKLSVVGGEKAAEVFLNLAKAQERAKATTDALNSARAKSAELMRVNEYMAEAQALNASGAAAQATAQQFSVLSSAKMVANDNMGKLRAQASAAAGVIGQLGGAFTTLAPAAGFAQTTLQRFLVTGTGLLGVLGPTAGPAALIVGVVSGVASLAQMMSNASKEADTLAKATEKNAQAMGTYLDRISKLRSEVGGKVSGARAEKSLQADLGSGKGTSEAYETEIGTRQEALNKRYSAAALEAANDRGGEMAVAALLSKQEVERRQLEVVIAKYTEFQTTAASLEAFKIENEDAKAKIAAAESTFDKPGTAKKKSGSWDEAAAEAANREKIEKLQALESEYEVKKIAREFEAIDRRREQGEIELEEYKARKEEELRFTQEGRDEEQAGFEKQMADMAAKRQQTNAAMLQGASIFAKSTVSVLQAAIKGHKMNAAAMVESIGDQLAASGTAHLLQAAAMAFIPGLQGNAGGLAAVGAIELAVGLGMGAAGAHSAGGSSGGGGGSSGSSGSTPVRSGGSEQAEATPTVVYVNFTSLTGPTPEQGRQVAQALEASYRVYGEDGTSRA